MASFDSTVSNSEKKKRKQDTSYLRGSQEEIVREMESRAAQDDLLRRYGSTDRQADKRSYVSGRRLSDPAENFGGMVQDYGYYAYPEQLYNRPAWAGGSSSYSPEFAQPYAWESQEQPEDLRRRAMLELMMRSQGNR